MLNQFQIFSAAARLPTTPFQMAVVDIVWDTGTPTPTPTPSPVCSSSDTSATTLLFCVKKASWAAVHFKVHGGGQQNFRMRQDSGNNTCSAGGLKAGEVVRYSLTNWNVAKNYAVDTAIQGYTMK